MAFRRQQEDDAAALLEAVCQHMQRWRLRGLVRAWQQHTACCTQGRAALQRMAAQADRQATSQAFGAWRAHLAHRRERLASLTTLVTTRQRQRAQQAAFDAWRQQTDDRCGVRMQERHAAQVVARLRLRQVLLAWQRWQHQRADRRQRWDAAIAHMRQRGNLLRMDAAFASWLEHVAELREQRAIFFRCEQGRTLLRMISCLGAICRLPTEVACQLLTHGCAASSNCFVFCRRSFPTTRRPVPCCTPCSAVQHMALRRMSVAFQAWRYLAAWRQHARAVVQQSVVRLSQRSLGTAWQAWQAAMAEARVQHHRVAVCQRRRALALQRSALAGWRQVAAVQAAEQQMIAVCQRRANRNR